jgi:hypothetical protein
MVGKLSLTLIAVASLASAQWALVNTLSQEQTNGGSLLGTLNAPTLPLFLNDTVRQFSRLQQRLHNIQKGTTIPNRWLSLG